LCWQLRPCGTASNNNERGKSFEPTHAFTRGNATANCPAPQGPQAKPICCLWGRQMGAPRADGPRPTKPPKSTLDRLSVTPITTSLPQVL
jgi:hypothetical protein